MDNALRDTPKEITEILTTWGGKNQYGEPCWRLILAQNHLVTRAGLWTNFEGNETQIDFGGVRVDPRTGKPGVGYETKQIAPTSTMTGIHRVPLYMVDGWILERWFPAKCFGGKEKWYSHLSQDNITPMMGPYPERGDYWMLDGPWDEIPPTEYIRREISAWENSPNHGHGEFDEQLFLQAMMQYEDARQRKEEEQHKRLMEQADYTRRHFIDPVLNNPRLHAWRDQQMRDAQLSDVYTN